MWVFLNKEFKQSGHFPSNLCTCAAPLSRMQREKSKHNDSCSFRRFSRQIISGLRPLAPTLCSSLIPCSIITCHSFDLFISWSLGWAEVKRNPIISGSWLCSLCGELGWKTALEGWEKGNWREDPVLTHRAHEFMPVRELYICTKVP